MFCEKCGTELSPDIKFCPKCGTPVQSVDTNNDSGEWYYINSGTRYGPFPNVMMISFINNNTITANTPVWKQGMMEWLPAYQTEFADALGKTLPPVPMAAISSKYAWALATVPILASWIIGQFGAPLALITICAVSLNVVFTMLDTDVLNKAGLDVNSWMWMGLVLVPAYLFLRASKTDRKYGYAITWCVMCNRSITPRP